MQRATTQPVEKRVTLDSLPRVNQKLELTCEGCGKSHTYDVGRILLDQDGDGESATTRFAFGNYFRCCDCGSAGPWKIADYLKMIDLTLRARLSGTEGTVAFGKCALFDGTSLQTPALGEEYLLRLIDQDARNAFLQTRLGNLLRGCGQRARALEWYEKALALDAGDIEARFHLYNFAVEDCDVPAAIHHAPLLVRYLLNGRETNVEELTRGIALMVADTVRRAPGEFRAAFLGQPAGPLEPLERTFIRTLLEQQGDEEDIVTDASDRLLEGEVEPAPSLRAVVGTDSEDDDNEPPIDLVPPLRALVEKNGLNERNLSVAVEVDEHGQISAPDRHSVRVYDGHKVVFWPVVSLRELFRGNQSPPADMSRYPPEYCGYFFCLENHLRTVCDAQGDRTDQEMESIYSALRRRPDGRSLGPAHDSLWQVAALMLGTHVLSQLQFEAIVGQLERSVRSFASQPVSRNYLHYLRQQLPD